uniref:SAP domain-containing protein n=1 Tax=Pectinophora gossypiella TaxID=13191 RepID=A0A1E1WCR3_PECGO
MSDRKRLLTDLRVIDLRAELEKRNLDKSGVRGVLIQRLSKYLEEEGHDPTTFRFDLTGLEPKSTPTKRTRRSESAVEPETEETPAMEDMIVQDDAGEEEDVESGNDALQNVESEDAAAGGEDSMDVDANDKINRKRDIQDDDSTEATEPKKPCLDKEDDHKNENNTDADDSINLDIGDDELLNEETDSTSKLNKKGKFYGRNVVT